MKRPLAESWPSAVISITGGHTAEKNTQLPPANLPLTSDVSSARLGGESAVGSTRNSKMMNATSNDLFQFILGRRSIRVYAPGEVGDADVSQLLQAAMAAPSAVAKDPWRFVVIRKKETLSTIAAALPNGGMLATASLGIVVCGDLDAAHDRQLSYLLQDCSAAIENLLLCAHALGLGACWLGVHPREDRVRKLREILLLPASVIPVAGIAIGRPGEGKEARTRFNRDYVHWERW